MSLHQAKTAICLSGLVVVALACSPGAAEPEPVDPTATPVQGSAAEASPTPASPPVDPTPDDRRDLLYTPVDAPPMVVTSTASVSLDQVVFDTFRGGFIPLSFATHEFIEILRDVIKPIYVPEYGPVQSGDWLLDDDLVIGYVAGDEVYAYPVKIMNLHEIVNDYIDDVPVAVTYCPLCASGVVFRRDLDGQDLVFGNTSALYESDMVMYDHQTGSYWFQMMGEAIVGPLTGKRLTLLPSVTTSWKEWKRQHPDTLVLSKDLGLVGGGFGNPYERDSFEDIRGYVNRGQFVFPVSMDKLDGRLRLGDLAMAVQIGEAHKAYSLMGTADWLLNDQVSGESIVVIFRANGPFGQAFYRTVDGHELSFGLMDGAVQDSETASTWSDIGRAVSGPMEGTQLEAVPSRTGFWFSLSGAVPDIELYRPE